MTICYGSIQPGNYTTTIVLFVMPRERITWETKIYKIISMNEIVQIIIPSKITLNRWHLLIRRWYFISNDNPRI